MRVKKIILTTAGSLFMYATALSASDISRAGALLAETLDQMNVETLWLPGQRVNWESGEPLQTETPGKTHCSAFVAAVCKKMGIYILRPPEHSTKLLANAQYDWLASNQGQENKWLSVKDAFDAQEAANKGLLVIAVFQSPNPDTPGHIAIVRPSIRTKDEIEKQGPMLIQAGYENHNSADLASCFKKHKGAWLSAYDNKIKFYSHSIPKRKYKE